RNVTGVQTCALPISAWRPGTSVPARLANRVGAALVIPHAHGQALGPPHLVATFRWAPFAPPRNAALVPGGRLGPPSTPAVVAAAWERRTRAALRPVRRALPPGALAGHEPQPAEGRAPA